jgi:hypothetical protein
MIGSVDDGMASYESRPSTGDSENERLSHKAAELPLARYGHVAGDAAVAEYRPIHVAGLGR